MAYLVHRRRIMAEWGDCDPAGLVFHSRFFQYFDTSSWALFEAALGVPPAKLGATFDILGIPLVAAGARFVSPVHFGDAIEIQSTIGVFKRSSFEVQHHVFVDGALVVEGNETRVWAAVDKDDPAKLKSVPIPPEVIARFAAP